MLIGFLIGFAVCLAFFKAVFIWHIRKEIIEQEKFEQLKIADVVLVPDFDWGNLANGDSGNIALEIAWLRNAKSLYNLFTRKQRDYGPNALGLAGLNGVAVRLGDKLCRLWQLLGITPLQDGTYNTTPSVNESVRDIFGDVAVYCINSLLLIDGDWPLTDPDKAWGSTAVKNLIKHLEETENAKPEIR